MSPTSAESRLAGFIARSLCVFLAGNSLAQQPAKTFRVLFHGVNGLILLDATVNDKPAVLLLDTEADNSIVSPSVAGVMAKLRAET